MRNAERLETMVQPNHTVFYHGYEKKDAPTEVSAYHSEHQFSYEVLYSSFGAMVCIGYDNIDGPGSLDDDGLESCDLFLSGGGDCVGPIDLIECFKAAMEMHIAMKHAEKYKIRCTDG